MLTLHPKYIESDNSNKTFTIVKDGPIRSFHLAQNKRRQLEDLKQGIKEALLIKAGKMEAKPFSTLWDE